MKVFQLSSIIFLVASGCEFEPTNLKQEVVAESAAVVEEGTAAEDVTEEPPTPDGDTPVALSFAEFDAIAQVECGTCHNADSGRVYLVGVEQNAIDNSVNISARIKDPANPMPPAGLLEQAKIDQMDSYLNSVSQ